MNGDGRSDLLIPEIGKLAIAFATTTGAFHHTTTCPARLYSVAPTVADINGDGHVDIAIPTGEGIDILLGDGSGTFTSGKPVNCGPAQSIAFSELRKSGHLDLIATNRSADENDEGQPVYRMSVYPGKGNGTFSEPRIYVSPDGPTVLGVFDVNGDHTADVVLNNLTLYLGDGYGSLAGAPITISPYAAGIVTGDFNYDGKPDVAVTNVPDCIGSSSCDSTVTVFFGSGEGWFEAGKTYPTGITTARPPAPVTIAVGDVNGDGNLDLVVGGGEQALLSVLLGNSDGTFRDGEAIFVGNDVSEEVFLADVNYDKKLDIVLDTGVLLGKGDGTFGPVIPYPD